MTLEEKFKKAEADINTARSRPNNETLLLLYSYHKQVMKGDAPEEGPANVFDFIGRAKYEAWSKQRGRTKEECMRDYVALVEKVVSSK